jgi:hypothetical protein
VSASVSPSTAIEYESNIGLILDHKFELCYQLGKRNRMSIWNTSGRPIGKNGLFGFNITTLRFEIYINNVWYQSSQFILV